MQCYKVNDLTIHQTTEIPDLTPDEADLIDAWHTVAIDRMPEDKRDRIARREVRMGRPWIGGGDKVDDWHARTFDQRAGRFCLLIGSGVGTMDALRRCGYERWVDWLTWSGATSWQCVYVVARETAIEMLTDRAQDRLMANVASGEDGGYKSATYLLDWWRQCHGLNAPQHEDQSENRSAGVITYNIAVIGDSVAQKKMCGARVASDEITVIPQ